VKITVDESVDRPWALFVRIPGWCQNFDVKINGQEVSSNSQKGYLSLRRLWKAGDVVETNFAMSPIFLEADPRADSVRGCVAIQRGPIVYCLEEQDQSQGINLLDVNIDPSEALTSRWQGDLLGGIVTIEAVGHQIDRSIWQDHGGLYRPLILKNENRHTEQKVKLTAIPYFAWGNRGLKSMRVWIPHV
jgi:hypothetical protein